MHEDPPSDTPAFANSDTAANFTAAALVALPVLSNVNAKYTSGSATGDYNAMTVQITLGKIAVSILFTGNGDGTGDVLLTTGPTGERICTVTLDITNQSATAMVGWDLINSTMNTPTLQSITNNYQGSSNTPLPVELTSFTASTSNGCPYKCTPITAFVLAVILASIFVASICQVSDVQSTNTGVAPQ